MYLEVLEKRKVKLGFDHPDTSQSIRNLSLFYQKQGLHDKANAFIQKIEQEKRNK
eukprot:gene15140-20389_t